MSVEIFRKICESKLGLSEPDPRYFGNPANEMENPEWTNKNWLKSRFHFSFAEYNNPKNTNFGVLRVLNDDLVQPDRGFGEHPHRDVEICTYVVEGKLTHTDSMGTSETLSRGAVQFMTAGTGVRHSEHNLDKNNPLRFIQVWITTRNRGLQPCYGSTVGDYDSRHNTWHHLVSDRQSTDDTPIKINQNANIFVSEIDFGEVVEFEIIEGRQVYTLCMEGAIIISGAHGAETLERHEAAEVFGPNCLTFSPQNEMNAHILLIEMAFSGIGRRDL